MKRGKSYEWIPLWIDKWLMGSTRFELEPGERSVFIDLMVLGAKDDGYIRANASMGYPHEYLARTLNVTVELLDSSIAKCIQFGKLKKLKNGVYYVKSWEAYRLSVRHKRRVMSENTDIASAKADVASDEADAFYVSVLSKSSNKNLKVLGNTKDKKRTMIIVDAAWDLFWEKYPRKVGKEDAFAGWTRLMKEKTPETDILKALDNYLVQIKADKIETKFIKHPTTFLNKNRWKDYLQLHATGGKPGGSESLADFDARVAKQKEAARDRFGTP